jgi:hypothetical protein
MAPTDALEPAFYLVGRSGGDQPSPNPHEIYNTTYPITSEPKKASFENINGPWVAVLIFFGGAFVYWLIFRAWRKERRGRDKRGKGVKLDEGRDGVEMDDRVDGSVGVNERSEEGRGWLRYRLIEVCLREYRIG